MKHNLFTLCFVLAGSALVLLPSADAGNRVGGNAELVTESLNGGGTAFSSNGIYRLGGTLGQNNFIAVTTNGTTVALNGFWKGDSACALYPTKISELTEAGDMVSVTFNVLKSNTYSLVSIDEEDGGLVAGLTSWTNQVASFTATTGLGSQTTLVDNVSSVTNRARYYLIRCE